MAFPTSHFININKFYKCKKHIHRKLITEWPRFGLWKWWFRKKGRYLTSLSKTDLGQGSANTAHKPKYGILSSFAGTAVLVYLHVVNGCCPMVELSHCKANIFTIWTLYRKSMLTPVLGAQCYTLASPLPFPVNREQFSTGLLYFYLFSEQRH